MIAVLRLILILPVHTIVTLSDGTFKKDYYHKYVKYIEGKYPDILSLGFRWMLTTTVTPCLQFIDGEGVWVDPSAVWDMAENILPKPESEPRFLARPVRSIITY
jgi:hypothetical protein